MLRRTPIVLVLAAAALGAGARVTLAAEPFRPVRVTAPPVIDGHLDEAAWQQAPQITGFQTWTPDYGLPVPDQTVVFAAYDAENLYFAFRAYDSEPGKIKASMASRDTISADDWICINLDSFNDQQSLYAFYVNPLGIQGDSRYAAGREDAGFDAVWYSAGQVDAEGYAVEVRIPFKSLRYRGGDVVTMGVIFERRVSRRAEGTTYPPLDPRAGMNFLIQMHPIVFTGIRHYTLLEVLPDVTYSRHDEAAGGTLLRASSGGDLGVTAKYGVTADLTVDGTYNPDFSQVEADAGQIDINLRSPLFFAEKRPFFLEGADVFNLGAAQSGPLQAVVHTRTIVNPRAGVRLTGKLAAADTIASIYAVDELPPGEEPGRDYAQVAILRYKRSLSQDSYLGTFYTGREAGGAFNRVGGADGMWRFSQSSHLGFHALGSYTRESGGAAVGSGHAVGSEFTYSTRRLQMGFSAVDVSRAFAVESGYLTRTGVSAIQASAVPRFYPGSRIVRRVDVGANTSQTRDAFSGIWETWNEGTIRVVFAGASSASAGYHRSTEVFAAREFGTSGVSASGSVQISNRLRLQASAARGDAIYYAADPFGGRSLRASLAVVYQPVESWSQSLSVTYANFDRAADGWRIYDYGIVRSRTSWQANRFFLFRGIVEYNSFRRQLVTDLLGSFTYIPGTVVHAGYGSLYERLQWDGSQYAPGRSFVETRRGLFFKASYLWRL